MNEFVQKQIYFASPKSFNDPFDCQIEYERVIREFAKSKDFADDVVDTDIDKIRNVLDKAGICCFSKAKKNQLMWSHYADNHKGICIGFNRIKLATAVQAEPKDVIYQAKHPLANLNWHYELDEAFDLQDNFSIYKSSIYPLITTKYTHWKYEREVRLLRREIGLVDITPNTINSVTFGLSTPDKTKVIIRSLLQEAQWKHVKLFQAEKHKEKYELVFRSLERTV